MTKGTQKHASQGNKPRYYGFIMEYEGAENEKEYINVNNRMVIVLACIN
jgi:hypothetical protein